LNPDAEPGLFLGNAPGENMRLFKNIDFYFILFWVGEKGRAYFSSLIHCSDFMRIQATLKKKSSKNGTLVLPKVCTKYDCSKFFSSFEKKYCNGSF
jgi:hypothetical protein